MNHIYCLKDKCRYCFSDSACLVKWTVMGKQSLAQPDGVLDGIVMTQHITKTLHTSHWKTVLPNTSNITSIQTFSNRNDIS